MLADAAIPRARWKDNPIEIYIDALLLLEPYRNTCAASELIRFMCDDFKRFSDVDIVRMATVVVENDVHPVGRLLPSNADNPKAHRCAGAQMANNVGLIFGKHRKYNYEPSEDLGRFLYVAEYRLLSTEVLKRLIFSRAFRLVGVKIPDIASRVQIINEAIQYLRDKIKINGLL